MPHSPPVPLVTSSYSETEPLLRHAHRSVSDGTEAESANKLTNDSDRRQLGLLSAISLIFNRIIGTGVFAAPSILLESSGSVGLTFVMWIIGASVSAAGAAVYVEFGTGLPQNGGEKAYLEYIYRRPQFLITCVYASYGIFLVRHVARSSAYCLMYLLLGSFISCQCCFWRICPSCFWVPTDCYQYSYCCMVGPHPLFCYPWDFP